MKLKVLKQYGLCQKISNKIVFRALLFDFEKKPL